MYSSRQEKNQKITVLDRKDITDYIRTFVWHMRDRGRIFNTRHLGEVKNMVEQINLPENTAFKSARDIHGGYLYWDRQKVEFVPSNLGPDRGYIFYFRCNGCYRRVKYLYEYSMLESPLCRICCRLQYEQPSRKARAISRAIRKPYLSGETKYMLIKRAGITMEDVAAAAT
ncbi:MAG: hypothetical protein ABSB00_02155 [Minisyncoccia bacterium]|jgi:hypothetical protein